MESSRSWTKLTLLGAGSYGSVFLASDDSSKSNVAAVKSAEYGVLRAFHSLKAEGKFLTQLIGQPNIVRCFGEDISVEDGGRVVYNLLLEYAAGGTLQDLIKNAHGGRGRMTEAHVACYASMMLRGLAAVHSQGIVHCDLKPANILVFPVRGGGISNLKIADFGLARRVSEKEALRPFSDGRKSYNRGTPLYSSPESMAFGLHGTCADIWSFGCIVVEMITGERLWNYRGPRELFHQILFEVVELPRNLSEGGVDFLRKCLAKNPLERWSAAELLKHPFIVNNLKKISTPETERVDLNREQKNKNPFGECGWVSKRHLFSTWIWETLQKQKQQQQQKQDKKQQQFESYNLFPEQQSQQPFHQFPCGGAVVDLLRGGNSEQRRPIHDPDNLCGREQPNWLQV